MTLGTMTSRIHDELSEVSLTAQIRLAVVSAVKHYDRESVYFTETSSFTVTPSASQEYYSSSDESRIGDLPGIDSIVLRVGDSSYRELTRRSKAYLDAIQTNPDVTGEPLDYAYYERKIRLYPVPNTGTYVLIISGSPKGTLTASASASSIWLDEGEELIRARAKADVEINVLRNPERRAEAAAVAPYYSIMEKIAHQALIRETVSRGTAEIAPNQF